MSPGTRGAAPPPWTPDPRITGPQPPAADPCLSSIQPPTPDPCVSCPFCHLAGRELIAENDLAVALRDGYPVNPGHTLIIPRRHVATWFQASRDEQLAILELLDEVKAELDAKLTRSSATPSPARPSARPCWSSSSPPNCGSRSWSRAQ